MNIDFIDNPEVGRSYLVRRKLNGSGSTRFQPAKILARDFQAGSTTVYEGYWLTVLWLTDNVKQDRVLESYGSVKELTSRWVKLEYAQALQEQEALVIRIKNLFDMQEDLLAFLS